jgi:uncharacterized protein YjbI with pentapeptide repeats
MPKRAEINPALAQAVLERFRQGRSLADLELPSVGDRMDLRGLVVPPGTPRWNGAQFRGLDFTGGKLDRLELMGSSVQDCVFDRASCRDWRTWATEFRSCTFVRSNLRGSFLGGEHEGRTSSFVQCDFSQADLRQTAHHSAEFTACVFADAKLTKVDFQGSRFRNCEFAGELSDVLFYRHAFKGESLPPNEMAGVDFRRATFVYVGFRNLDLRDVKWPANDDHFVVRDFKGVLQAAIGAYADRDDPNARGLRGLFEHTLKWAGPEQEVGVISKRDLIDVAGPKSVDEFAQICAEHYARQSLTLH